LDPDSQRDVLRLYVEANSDDAGLGARWIPDKPILVTESTHDAQLMIGTIMMGATVKPRVGQDAGQMVVALLLGMTEICKRILSTTQIPTMPELVGLANLAGTIERYLAMAAQDQGLEGLVKQSRNDLGELAKIVQQWSVQLQEQQQPQQGGQDDAAKEAAVTDVKLKSIALTAQTKAEIAQSNAAQKQEQRQKQFEQKQRQSEESHTADLRKKLKETEVNTAVADIKSAADIRRSQQEPEPEPVTT